MSRVLLYTVLLASLLAACDAVQPSVEPELVVEAYVTAGPGLPPVFVRSTHPLDTPPDALLEGLDDAVVVFTLNGVDVPYELTENGRYDPVSAGPSVQPGDSFSLTVSHDGRRAVGTGRVPPSIQLTTVDVLPSLRPIPAVLVDSLDIGLDSLDLGLDAAQGFIYPVEVSVSWNGIRSDFWLETQLRPENVFSSSVLDFFLLPNAVQPESHMASASWRGVYAVPVPESDSPMPSHALLVGIARGDAAFAAFASGRIDTSSRTPTSNVAGGLGFIGGVAIDTVRIAVGTP